MDMIYTNDADFIRIMSYASNESLNIDTIFMNS